MGNKPSQPILSTERLRLINTCREVTWRLKHIEYLVRRFESQAKDADKLCSINLDDQARYLVNFNTECLIPILNRLHEDVIRVKTEEWMITVPLRRQRVDPHEVIYEEVTNSFRAIDIQ